MLCCWRLYPPPESIQFRAETVVYFGVSCHVWGHCLTDNIRRLWFLKSDIFKQEFKNCPIVYIPFGVTRIIENLPNFRRLLEILDVEVDKLRPISQPTRFEKIVLPDESFFFDGTRKFTNEYLEAIERIRYFALKNRTPTSNEKIYYFHGTRQIGEERLAEYFKSRGYEVISPEKLTLDEQLNLLINCKSFAATLGSISHNSIFLREDVESIFILREPNNFNEHQRLLNQVHPVNSIYMDSSLSIFCKALLNIFYILSPQLKRFFGDKFDGYEEEDFKNFLRYIKNAENRGLSVNSNAVKLYGTTFTDFMAQLKQREDLITACNMPPHWEKFQPSPFCYQTHVGGKGWGAWSNENQISNDLEQKRQIEAIKIYLPNHKVYYSVYYNEKEGWSEEVSNCEMAGTTGKAKAIFGIRIRLDEAGAKEFDIIYRVHKFDGTWTDWAKNGETIYSHGQKLNAIQIKLTKN